MSWFRRINLLALILCFVIVVFGAYVRLSDAGLGCPDWPGCYGHLTVAGAQAHAAGAVQAPKAWKEMIHRYLVGDARQSACSAALAVLAACASCRRRVPPALVGCCWWWWCRRYSGR